MDVKLLRFGVLVFIAAAIVAAGLNSLLGSRKATAAPDPVAAPATTPTVTLTDSQMGSITVAAVADQTFQVEKYAVGSIDFNEDLAVQVFTPFQGRIIETHANLGDNVKKDQVLFTIESADFLTAESNLIAAAAVRDQTLSALERAKKLYAAKGIDQNDYEAAVASEQAADGAVRAARDAVKIFGKTNAEIDGIVASRHVDPALVVRSPVSGRVTARNASPGLFVQPGSLPAPYAVADLSTVWLVASITEIDSPLIRVGQDVAVSVDAYPGRQFNGTISAVGESVDLNTRRLMVRSVIKDPKHELRAGMFANFTIRTGDAITGPAVPQNGVVREGDGTMSVWVTTDRRHFQQRIVRIGLQRDKFDQVVDGVHTGELVAVDGAIFLSNIAFGGAS
ncbi:MAG: efflux RND transporter periplasmic adaptor subunit [Steroidobacterales bacterium]